MKIIYQKIINSIKNKLKKLYDFAVLSPNNNESLFQYILRFFLIPSSAGIPSWTYTLVVYFAIIFGFVYIDETYIAHSIVKEYDAAGKLIKEYMKGYSTGFWSMILSLSAAVVFFIKFRDQRNKCKTETSIEEPIPTEEDKKNPSIIQTVIDTARDILKK